MWSLGKTKNINVSKQFWIELVKKLLDNNITPVMWNHFLSYDLSDKFTEKCILLQENDLGKVLTAMRTVGCTLDIFSGISRLSGIARTPFMAVDERSRYVGLKEYELDDLFNKNLPKKYIFSFSTLISEGGWDESIFNIIINKLNDFIPNLNRDSWPSTIESNEIIPHDVVRPVKNKKVGKRFIKMNKE